MADEADAAAATAQAIVKNADRLGLVWNLRNATVIQTATPPDAVPAIYDNDSAIIGMTSLVGPLFAGMRVWVIEVPPSGNYIVGVVNSGPPRGTGQAGNYYVGGVGIATSSGVETAVPAATWTSEPYVTFPFGRITALDLSIPSFTGGANVCLSFMRVRKGSATTSGQILGEWRVIQPAGLAGQVTGPLIYTTYVKATTQDLITKLSLTNTFVIGLTSSGFYGDTTYPLTITPRDVCAVNDSASLRAIARTV